MSDNEEMQSAEVRDSVPSDSPRVVKDVSIEMDPHAKAKKVGVACCVVGLGILSVATFGLMQVVYSDYFEYKATENLAKERLEELSAAHQKKKADLAEILKGFVERVQARTNDLNEAILEKERELEKLKEEAARLPNVRESLRDVQAQFVAESNLLVRARQERDQAMEGVREAQASYGEWQAKESAARAAVGEWEARKGALEKDVDELVQETNRIERVIVELKKVRREVADERDELKKVEGELSAAKTSLEEKKRAVQEAEEARLKAVGEKTRAEADAKEYERVSAALSSLKVEEKELKARIAQAKGDAESAEEMGKEIAALQARLKDLTRETKNAEAARGVALDQKRAAESARDKAQNECERIEAERVQAEASWKKRKEEIETLTKGMEDIFNLRWSSFVK